MVLAAPARWPFGEWGLLFSRQAPGPDQTRPCENSSTYTLNMWSPHIHVHVCTCVNSHLSWQLGLQSSDLAP